MLKDSPRPMPAALRQRLRDIARSEVACRDVDRLYRAVRSRAWGGEAGDPGAERHLAECPRCAALYATLESAFAVRRLPLPRRLAGNLAAIARHPQRFLPVWIADSRYAAAACYLLATLTLTLAGDASALLRDTTATVSSRAEAWVDETGARGRQTWDATAAKLGRGIEDAIAAGWQQATGYGVACERFITDAYASVADSTLKLIPGRERPVQGDQDDPSRNDRE
jgi:hypothetical protein